MKMTRLFTAAVLAAIVVAISPAVHAEEFQFHHEHILGTSLELRISVEHSKAASQVEQAVLAEINRLASIFSRYDAESELMRWERGQVDAAALSPELLSVLNRAEYWRRQSGGAFDVRAGALIELWQEAEKVQALPHDNRRQALVSALLRDPWRITERGILERQDELPISLDALAKGYILDAVCERVSSDFSQVTDFTINIGGDIRKLGNQSLPVAITHPAQLAEGDQPLYSFTSSGPLAMATSGGYQRHFVIQGRSYSHILDPRTGFPCTEIQSASVLAPTAMDADAVATALCVLGTEAGLKLIESLPQFECLIQTADGKLTASTGWPNRPHPETSLLIKFEDEKKPGLTVDFTLNRPRGGPYRRPYFAIWLEDEEGFPVKTAVLWMQTEQPGPRWHRDLARWYRHDRVRKVAEKTDLVATIAGATRGPGKYKARFDGTDNTGDPLPPGKYVLCIEAVREHGTYQLVKKPIELGKEPIESTEIDSNEEFDATFQYIPWTN